MIQRTLEYDEEKVKSELAKEVNPRNFASLKNRLWQMLKHFLRSVRAEKTMAGRGFSLVQTADILQKKGLLKAAKRELKSAEKIAKELDLIDLRLEVNEVRRNLVFRYQTKKLNETIEELLMARARLLLLKMQEEAQLAVYSRISVLMRSDFELRPQRNREVAKKLLEDDLLVRDLSEATFRARRLQMMSRSFCFHTLGDLVAELEENEKIMDLWNQYNSRRDEFSDKYRVSLCNYLHVSAKVAKYERFPEIIARLESLPIHNEDDDLEVFSVVGHYKLLYYLNEKDIASAKSWVGQIEEKFFRLSRLINPSTRIGMMLNFALANFLDEDGKAASKWIELINSESIEHRYDLQGLARILEILMLIDQKEAILAGARVKSTQEWLRSKERLLDFENSVLKILRTMVGKAKGDWYQFYPKILQEMNRMEKENGVLQGMEEVQVWCTARITGQPMGEVLTTEFRNVLAEKGVSK